MPVHRERVANLALGAVPPTCLIRDWCLESAWAGAILWPFPENRGPKEGVMLNNAALAFDPTVFLTKMK
jgi:hypothetical protein